MKLLELNKIGRFKLQTTGKTRLYKSLLLRKRQSAVLGKMFPRGLGEFSEATLVENTSPDGLTALQDLS